MLVLTISIHLFPACPFRSAPERTNPRETLQDEKRVSLCVSGILPGIVHQRQNKIRFATTKLLRRLTLRTIAPLKHQRTALFQRTLSWPLPLRREYAMKVNTTILHAAILSLSTEGRSIKNINPGHGRERHHQASGYRQRGFKTSHEGEAQDRGATAVERLLRVISVPRINQSTIDHLSPQLSDSPDP